jgi:hypothetical protein
LLVDVRRCSWRTPLSGSADEGHPGLTRLRGYVHADLRNRWQKFARYVEHADKQAETLAEQPRGTNYDLLADGYTHVVTLVCSTVPEFVDTDDPNFLVRDDLPRIATPPELRNYLAEATKEDLKALPFARRISGR